MSLPSDRIGRDVPRKFCLLVAAGVGSLVALLAQPSSPGADPRAQGIAQSNTAVPGRAGFPWDSPTPEQNAKWRDFGREPPTPEVLQPTLDPALPHYAPRPEAM